MKSFQTYFYEAKRVFEFRIKLAQHDSGHEPDIERIKQALEAYKLETITPPKRLPIQGHREFPQWGPCECYVIDISLAYPAIAPEVRQIISERSGIKLDWIIVYPLNQAIDTEEAESHNQDHTGAFLDEEELADAPGGQEMVGHSRVGSLMKELSNHTRKYEIAGNDNTDGAHNAPETITTGRTTNDLDLKPGIKSPMGSNQNKVYNPRKGNKK
jgi:hypothetical protein